MATATSSFNQNWELADVPSSTFIIPYGYTSKGDIVRNTLTNNRYVLVDYSSSLPPDPLTGEVTYLGCVFQQIVTSANISDLLPAAAAWNISSVSLAFNTARTPSNTNNVTVIVSFQQSSTVLTAAIAQFQLNISGVWTTIGTASLSGLLTSQVNSITVDVPKGMQYRIINAGGTNSVISIFETVK